MMTLVGQFDSPFVRRVAITLHHYGMPFRRNAISVFGDAKEMAKITPVVRIPSLVLETGEVLIDSGAIIDHLDRFVGDERSLMPSSLPLRTKTLQIMAYATAAIDKMGNIVYERHFHPPEHVNQDWVARCRTQLQGALGALEAMDKAPFFLGERFSQADITTGVMLGYLKLRLDDAFPPDAYPLLEKLSQRLEAMQPFMLSRPSHGETMPRSPTG